jgi:hypothetical protein
MMPNDIISNAKENHSKPSRGYGTYKLKLTAISSPIKQK